HLTGELFKSLAGTPDIVHVPYRGSGPATADTLSGQVSMVTPAVTGPLLEFHRTGKLRIIAVTSPNRLIGAPDIPTAVEAGLAGMVALQSIGLFAPAGTPKAIIEQIAKASRTALAERAYQEMLIETGFEPDVDSDAEKLRRLIDEDIARWGPLVKAIGLKLDSRVTPCQTYGSYRPISSVHSRQSCCPAATSSAPRPLHGDPPSLGRT